MFQIENYVRIRSGKIFDGKELIYNSNKTFNLNQFLKGAYSSLKVSYPKFHKMDGLSKLGILAMHVLVKDRKLPGDTGLVFSNSAASLEVDKVHQESMAGIVSPAVFVYTLPNIVLGEISIKYKLQSESAFFVSEVFNPALIYDYSHVLLEDLKVPAVVCGWIEWKNDQYDVFLCLISRKGDRTFSAKNLEEIYCFENE